MKRGINVITTILIPLGFLALSSIVHAVSPPPDGGYPGGNTAEGQNALLSLSSGAYNTAVGFLSLESNTIGAFNTAVGAGALLANTAAENTATGAGALLSNTIGSENTANGAFALSSNTEGQFNTANGKGALEHNVSGNDNTASGFAALDFSTSSSNTAIGNFALANDTSGASNTAIGDRAGLNQTTGSNNVYIGAGINGVAGESNTCRIASIFGQTAASGSAVFITSGNKLGTDTSSRRFKEDIKPMEKASEALLALKPVMFRYKKEIDPQSKSQFGLVAEDVEKVNPDLVVHDKESKPYSVRYDQVNAMLLNEFLKLHERVQELNATVAKQKAAIERQRKDFEAATAQQRKDFRAVAAEHEKEIRTLTATMKKQASQIQKVSARLEVNEPRSQTVLNNP